MLVAAVALFVAAPLTEGLFRERRGNVDDSEIERLEHERGLAVQSLRELDFDHEMGKVDENDYASLRATLEARALTAMSALQRAGQAGRGARLRIASRNRRRSVPESSVETPRGSSGRRIKFCPQCGAGVGSQFNFCAGCGTALGAAAVAASRGE